MSNDPVYKVEIKVIKDSGRNNGKMFADVTRVSSAEYTGIVSRQDCNIYELYTGFFKDMDDVSSFIKEINDIAPCRFFPDDAEKVVLEAQSTAILVPKKWLAQEVEKKWGVLLSDFVRTCTPGDVAYIWDKALMDNISVTTAKDIVNSERGKMKEFLAYEMTQRKGFSLDYMSKPFMSETDVLYDKEALEKHAQSELTSMVKKVTLELREEGWIPKNLGYKIIAVITMRNTLLYALEVERLRVGIKDKMDKVRARSNSAITNNNEAR